MDLTVSFKTITCCVAGCGITFAVSDWFEQKRREDHISFYCPNGHKQYFAGKSDLDIARHELAKTMEDLFRVKNCAETKKRRITALKGVITKMRRSK